MPIYEKTQQTLSNLFEDLPLGNCKYRVQNTKKDRGECLKAEMTCEEFYSEEHCGMWKARDKTKGRGYWKLEKPDKILYHSKSCDYCDTYHCLYHRLCDDSNRRTQDLEDMSQRKGTAAKLFDMFYSRNIIVSPLFWIELSEAYL